MFNAKKFCNDYNIRYAREGKHFDRKGVWVNISCPFCAGSSHSTGGINTAENFYNCYRCGYHDLNSLIAILTRSDFKASKDIVAQYNTAHLSVRPLKHEKNTVSEVMFPSGTDKLTEKAKKYLIKRKFDPDKISFQWGILATNHIGFYKHRILAPIYQNSQLVSYQCRDITGKHPQKYLACRQEEEIKEHQHCIYGLDQAKAKKRCIVVEGITDVWRLGPGAVAVFGIDYTKQQAKILAENFNEIFILFDGEEQAQAQAQKLLTLIKGGFKNIPDVINLSLIDDIDPGELPQKDADNIMQSIQLK